LIGRESELAAVASFLAGARAGARGLLVHGEAGMGKTTIWQAALEASAARGYRVVVTRPTEAEARIPFAGLNDLFGDLVDAWGPELPPPQQAALNVALMRAEVGGEPMQPLALSLAVLELLRSAASHQPMALAVDDVQWLDESSAGVLRFAVRRLEDEPVILVATERTSAGSLEPAIVADLPADHVVRVPVRALSVDDVDRLLDESLGLKLAPTMLRRVHRLAGGSPFYSLEIGRALQARGVDTATGEPPMPESLSGLLPTRLASLPADASEVIVHVAGLSHPTQALIETAMGPARARAGLAEARAADVLTPDDDPLRFTHPLLASEVYGALDHATRRDLHRRLASIIHEPDERARHLALASDGPDPEVADALDVAANHASGRGAPDAAAELAVLAASLTARSEPDWARRMAEAGRYRLMAGDFARARELLERALEGPEAPVGPGRAELLLGLAEVRQLADDFAASDQLTREALTHAGEDAAVTISIKLRLAGISYITGREWRAGAQHAFEARGLAEKVGDHRLLAATLGPYLTWRYATGQGFDRDLAGQAVELEAWTARFRTLDLPEYDIATIELWEGETGSSLARLGRLVDRAERDGDYSSLPYLLGNLALGDMLDGRRDVARARVERAVRLSFVTDQRTAQVHTLMYQARLEARLGDADRAHDAGHRAFDLMEATSWRAGEWWLRADLALLELSRDDAATALGLVNAALEPPDRDESPRRRWAQAVAVEALVALGRLEDARRALDDFEEYAREHGSPKLIGEGRRARARLLAAGGDIEGADAAVAEAEAIHRRIEDPWELARTLLVSGEVHRRARRRARARAALREALETFAFLGAVLWAEQAREQLARIGASGRVDGGLTPTQRRVAELVVQGLTNRLVADRLAMSAHTVEAHLSAIYRELGISSRGELAAALSVKGAPTRDTTD
jgi:DNA-binding CsgD family transcriptional regulator